MNTNLPRTESYIATDLEIANPKFFPIPVHAVADILNAMKLELDEMKLKIQEMKTCNTNIRKEHELFLKAYKKKGFDIDGILKIKKRRKEHG